MSGGGGKAELEKRLFQRSHLSSGGEDSYKGALGEGTSSKKGRKKGGEQTEGGPRDREMDWLSSGDKGGHRNEGAVARHDQRS